MNTPENSNNMNDKPESNNTSSEKKVTKRKYKTNEEKVTESFAQYLKKLEQTNEEKDFELTEEKLRKVYYRKEETSETEAKQIANIASEFLEDFFIIGHNFKGDRIKIFKAQSKKDKDSLHEAIREAVIPIIFTEM